VRLGLLARQASGSPVDKQLGRANENAIVFATVIHELNRMRHTIDLWMLANRSRPSASA
jgi:hypothetical protein